MNMKHTPAPWTFFEGSRSVYNTAPNPPLHPAGIAVCIVCSPRNRHDDRVAANGHLIAAAPDMLAALTECDAALASWQATQAAVPGFIGMRPDDVLALIGRVRAAPAKAGGAA